MGCAPVRPPLCCQSVSLVIGLDVLHPYFLSSLHSGVLLFFMTSDLLYVLLARLTVGVGVGMRGKTQVPKNLRTHVGTAKSKKE